MDETSGLATLPSVVALGINNRLKDLHTAMPGIVESFDAATQTASIQPAIKRIFKRVDFDSEILIPTNLPLLINVPVVFPRGGGFSLTFPVTKGDECLLVFCERAIHRWSERGGIQEPGARRFHSLTDATAFVGLSSATNSVPGYSASAVQLKKDDGSGVVSIEANGSLTLTGTAIQLNGPVTMSSTLEVTGAATLEGGAAVTGTLTNNNKNVGDLHGHVQGPDSIGNVQAAIVGVT